MRSVRASFEDGVLVIRVPVSLEFNDATAIDPTNAGLSHREIAVLDMMRKGAGNKEIAGKLNIGVRSVKFHVSNILQKLSCESRAEVIYKYGHRWGS